MESLSPLLRNLVYLTEHLTDVLQVLNYLVQYAIVSTEEKEFILSKNTRLEKNAELIIALDKKDWGRVGNYVKQILRNTGNTRCADKIDGQHCISIENEILLMEEKWWPQEKKMIKAFHERTNGDNLLVDDMHLSLSDKRRIVITGIGGVGKTTAAKRLAWCYDQEYDHIIWFECSEGGFLKSFKHLALLLKIEMSTEIDTKEIAKAVYRRFHDTGFKFLIIFDDAERYIGNSGVKDYLPDSGEIKFHLIITSRCKEWGTKTGYGIIEQFPLDVFTDEESFSLLRTYLNDQPEDSALENISYITGNMPLLLQLAMATINAGTPIWDYIDKITKTSLRIKPTVQLEDYERRVITSMTVSLNIIKKEDHGEIATKILKIFAFVSSENIEMQFFADVLGISVQAVSNAVDILDKHSLIIKTGLHTKQYAEYHEYGFFKLFTDKKVNIVSRQFATVSIYTWFQEVMRHEIEKVEEECQILKDILVSKSFLENKMVPYSYAKNHKKTLKRTTENVDRLMYFFRKERVEWLIATNRIEEARDLQEMQFSYTNRSLKRKFDYLSLLMNILYFGGAIFYLLLDDFESYYDVISIIYIVTLDGISFIFNRIIFKDGLRAAKCLAKENRFLEALPYIEFYGCNISFLGWGFLINFCWSYVKTKEDIQLNLKHRSSNHNLAFWIIHLRSQLGTFRTSLKEFVLINRLKDISIEGNFLTVDLSLLKDIQNIKLKDVSLLYDRDPKHRQNKGTNRNQVLEFDSSTIFVDPAGEKRNKVLFYHLSIYPRKCVKFENGAPNVIQSNQLDYTYLRYKTDAVELRSIANCGNENRRSST